MSIFDIFTSKQPESNNAPAPAQQVNQQPTPGNIPDPQVTTEPNNPNAPVVDAANPAPAEQEFDSPLAEFKDLWNTESKPNEADSANPFTQLKPEDVQKVVAKANFASGLTPETLTAISAGGEEAQQAFAQAMNSVAQQVMTQAITVNNKLTEQAVTKALEVERAKLPDMLKNQAATNHLNDTNPLFSNPAIKPVVDATKQQLIAKFPNATPQQITEMTQNYITEMGKAFNPTPSVNDNVAEGETDWDAFLNS